MMRKIDHWVLGAALAAVLAGCAGRPTAAPTDVNREPSSSSEDYERVVILGTNDLHGALAPVDEDAGPSALGGAATLAAYARVLQEQHSGAFFWLDAGDQFQGTLESNPQEGATVVQALNRAGVTAAALGNHEFDFGPVGPEGVPGDPLGALKARVAEAKYPFLAANVVSRSTGNPPIERVAPSRIFVTGRGSKIGVIGLATTTTPTETRPEFVRELEFRALAPATLAEARKLRAQGAAAVVVVAHVGVTCGARGQEPAASRLRLPTDPDAGCSDQHEVGALLRALPPGTVDAVVSGHTHTVVHHWVRDVPVVQGGSGGRYLNAIHLVIDLRARRVVPEGTRIEGPVAVLNGARFRDRIIKPDPEVASYLAPLLRQVAAAKRQPLATVVQPVTHAPDREAALGNFIADAMRRATGAPIALSNAFGVRAKVLPAGTLTFGQVFACMPFDNFVAQLEVSGRELRDIMRIATSGATGIWPFSGLRATISADSRRWDDLNANGTREPWETRRLLKLETSAGAPIEDGARYRLALNDFLAQGGNDLGWAMRGIAPRRINFRGGGLIRDAMVAHAKALGTINGPKSPLVNPARPRLVIGR